MKHLCPLLLLLFLNLPCFSKHIIGGVLTYECLGNGAYRFTMKMYRDCSDPTGAGFDFNAPFSLYKGNNQLLTTIFVNPNTITSVDPPANPCMQVPSNVCVQEGIYVFEYQFSDWPSTESYHISYQRCCRNNTITNIQNPGDVGATFTVEILPASQALCNNSPVYDAFPPTVICANQAIVYNHSAVDAEGDQLVYELCSPLLGGGTGGLGGGSATGCNGIVPNPACPPPYQPANFINPPYSPLNPMGGNPPISINPVTGVLTGTPVTTGQFVVAICIYEYRNGQLLSVIRRDFQFNVANCTAILNASLSSPGIVVDGGDYYINTCSSLTIPFQNTSNSQNVNEVRWEFLVNDSIWTFDTWNVTVTFPETGSYEGKLLLNPGTQCGDSANVFVQIFPELTASFEYAYDTCFAGPVSFHDQSFISGPGEIAKWQWTLDNGIVDTVFRNPVHIYEEPKVVPVKLEVWDANGCSDDTVRSVTYKPVPALILVKPNTTITCAPAEVFFNNLSSPVDLTYLVEWDFGDGGTSKAISPTHTYREVGIYDVKLEITSPIGCFTDTLFQNLVEVQEPPVADFYFEPQNPSNFNQEVNFFDQSLHAVHWDWYINGRLVAQQQDFTYNMPDTGLHEVMLIITHPRQCQDTLVQFVDVEPKVTFFLPNAFSPNEDTTNDYFLGTGITRGITDFKMEIWDRYGNLIFRTSDIEDAWNGRVNNSGRTAPNGIYICIVTFQEPRGKRFEYRGYATLMR